MPTTSRKTMIAATRTKKAPASLSPDAFIADPASGTHSASNAFIGLSP
ncbi:hypothetical protein [Streptomyces antimycoticus]|nr:hypothetical protein [Streptomyces antimycoticus]